MIDCRHFAANRCRSCTGIELPYDLQLARKQQHCRQLLAPFDSIEWLTAVPSRTRGFRNKAKMVASGSSDDPVLGILDANGRSTDLTDCLLYPPALQQSFAPLTEFIRLARIDPYDVANRRGELKFLLVTLAEHSGELMVRFVLRSQESLGRIRKHLPTLQAAIPGLRVASVNLQPEHKAVLEGEQELALTEDECLTMQLNGIALHLRPRSFFQTNTEVAEALYRHAGAWIDEAAPSGLWDLFCGVGGFALHAALSAPAAREVVGVEISREAIASAERSRQELGLDAVRFVSADAAAFVLGEPRLPPMLIVNPPRRGIGAELCDRLQNSEARWLLYSSCNAESLARDLSRMPALKPRRALLLDMFPHTRHYEVLVLAQRD